MREISGAGILRRLLFFLAARDENRQTFRRAIQGDMAARRLLFSFGLTDTDLAEIDEARIARYAKALNTPAPCAAQLAEAEEHIRVLEQRLAAAASAAEHGPLTDIALWTGRAVRIWSTVLQAERVFHVHVPGYAEIVRPTPRQALLALRDTIQENLGDSADLGFTVNAASGSCTGALGEWRHNAGTQLRVSYGGGFSVRVNAQGWKISTSQGEILAHGPQTGEAGIRCADAAARILGMTLAGE